ncbi:helix-turn-helix domain-containing protein [Flavihumibacter rivuli]|uniref:helix-turn-helix domain-containing protein n=1 Tax=Flavihumibacter rivuli TaxID=2838156 RepID=UPI001BDEBF51|nr:helix-turn-helix domain-containing protein [Flavihumibacter rivuli]ULQ55573.1 helix-turn-helix domain-containing protein [Flavihumibacter rivuli]
MSFSIGNVINFVFLAIGSFLPLLLMIVLLSNGKWRFIPNRLLALYLFGMANACGMTFIQQSGLIYYVPWLFRLPSPFYYFMFPAGFLYVRMLLSDRNKLSWYDWLHFAPGVLHFFEMLPFYLKDREYKLWHISEVLKNPFGSFLHNEGWLPNYLHNIIRGTMGILYGLAILVLLVRFRRQNPEMKRLYPSYAKWLWTFGLMMTLFGCVFTWTLTFKGWTNPSHQVIILTIVYSSTQIIAGIVLFMNPSFLYGMPKISSHLAKVEAGNLVTGALDASIGHESKSAEVTDAVNSSEATLNGQANGIASLTELDTIYQVYREQIETFMQEKKPYLQPNYKIADLARDLKMPQHHITIVLNRVMQTRFNDFINRYRIEEIRKAIASHGLTHSLEGFAANAGFANRSTFIRAVERITGQTPSRYFLSKDPIQEEL